MPEVAYHRTVFLTGLQGQYRLLKGPLTSICSAADTVVQFGNIIGCTPWVKDREGSGANEAALKYTAILSTKVMDWVQLVGTNELAALNAPEEWTNAASRQMLRNAWLSDEPTMKVASASKGRLLTHGGLTYGEWVALGKPQTALEAAHLLNEKYAKTLYQGPAFKLGDPPNYSANPIWADTFMELYASWITAPEAAPFDQVHGSDNLNSDLGRAFITDKFSVAHYADDVRFRKFGSVVTIKGMEFKAIDLGLAPELTESVSADQRLKTSVKMLTAVPQHQAVYVEKTQL